MKLFFVAAILACFYSCTNIEVQNQPGKCEVEIPEFMRGKFDLVYPEAIQDMMNGGDVEQGSEKQIVEFTPTSMSFQSGDSIVRQGLNDSIAVCKIKSDYFLTIGSEPHLSVFLVKKKSDDLELFPMFCFNEITQADLEKYFTNVKSEEEGTFSVKVNPKKFKAYFDSGLPSKDPFILKRIK